MPVTLIIQLVISRIGLVIGVVCVFVAMSFLFTRSMPTLYTATTKILVERPERVTNSNNSSLFGSLDYLKTQLAIIRSESVARGVVVRMEFDNQRTISELMGPSEEGYHDTQIIKWLLKNLSVSTAKETKVVTIQFTSTTPESAASIANAFAESYQTVTLRLSVDPARKTAAWFGTQRTELRSALETAQRNLAKYQQEQGIYTSSENQDVEMRRLSELSQNVLSAEMAKSQAQSRVAELDALIGAGASRLPDTFASDAYRALNRERSDLIRARKELSSSIGPKHPQFIATTSEIWDMDRRLKALIAVVRENAVAELRLTETQLAGVRGELESQREVVLDFRDRFSQIPALGREVETAKSAYEMALRQFNDKSLQSRVNSTSVAVLTEAEPPLTPSGPNALFFQIIAAVLGALGAVAFIILAELFKPVVRTEEDIVEVLGIPVLGVLRT